MPDDERIAVSKHISEPETEVDWMSPTNLFESRESLVDQAYERVIDNPGYQPKQDYRITILCSGANQIGEDIAHRFNSEDYGLTITAVDIAPPKYAEQLAENNQRIELLEENVLDGLPDEKADMVYFIDGTQEFNTQEIKDLAVEINNHLYTGSPLVFNSTHNVLDVFRQLETEENNFIREKDGEEYVHVDAVTLEDVELDGEKTDITTPIVQTPQPYEVYRDIFEGEGFEEVDNFELEVYTDSVEKMVDVIEGDVSMPEDELQIMYKHGIMEKTEGEN